MKIIELLNKIANGEEVPNKIEYRDTKFLYDILNQCYIEENYNKYNDLLMELSNHKGTDLNYEVEIIEEEPRNIEVCGSYFTQEEYNKLAKTEEDKKIEKLNAKYTSQIGKIELAKKIDEIIDYLMENKQ